MVRKGPAALRTAVLELLDLTIADDRWRGRRKELTRARELLCDAMQGEQSTAATLPP